MDLDGKNQSYSAVQLQIEKAEHNQNLIFKTETSTKTAAIEQLEKLDEFTPLNTFGT